MASAEQVRAAQRQREYWVNLLRFNNGHHGILMAIDRTQRELWTAEIRLRHALATTTN